MKKNSGKNKEIVNFEKSLQDWKLPPFFSASDVFGKKKNSFCLFPDCTVKTVEKEIPLTQRRSTFPLFSNYRRKAHQIFHEFLQVGMIMVGVKPSKLGSNASAVICICDNRFTKYHTVLAMAESSLRDGPIFFSYFPTYCVPLSDSSVAYGIDVRVKGNERATLMYKFHYKVRKMPTVVKWDSHDGIIDVERGKTTLYLDNIAQGEGEGEGEGEGGSNSNRLVSKTINWYQIAIREGLMMPKNDVPLPTYGSDSEVGDTKIDWKETAEAHLLKVDVPGFKKEEVKVEVEDGNILQISGERCNDEQENDKWHREERSSTGKILRRFRLPENAKLEQVKAAMENGVLTVTVPKEEVKKPQVKVIDISG